MNYSFLYPIIRHGLFSAILLSLPVGLQALTSTAHTPSLGGIELIVDPYRETAIGLPLHRAAVAIAEVTDVKLIQDVQGDFVSLRLELNRSIGSPGRYGLNADTGMPAYYLEIVTGAAAGERLRIVANGSDWVMVEDELQGVLSASYNPTADRDRVRIRPCWTLDSVLPASSAPLSAQIEPSRDADALILHDQLFIQRFLDSADNSYYWAEWVSDEPSLADDYSILPGQVTRVRRAANGDSIAFALTGDATAFAPVWQMPTPAAGTVLEWPFSLTESVPVTLNDSGLGSVFVPAVSAAERQDELIVWANQTGFYARPAKRFYLQDTGANLVWRELGDTITDQGSYPLEPGKAYTIRRRGE